MSLDPLSSIVDAVTETEKVGYAILHKNQKDLIDDAGKAARADVETVKNALLDGRIDDALVLINGVQHGITTSITSDELNQLKQSSISPDFAQVLAFYQRARASDYYSTVVDIIQTTTKDNT